jgi:hypothetical protein
MVKFSTNCCAMNRQGFLVLFRSTSDTIVAGMLLSLAYLKAIQWLMPFQDPELNRIKETSIWQIFFVFQIALLIKMDDVDRDLLTACLLFVFFVNILILLVQYLVQCCGRHVCVHSTAAGEVGKDMGAVEMQKTSALAISNDAFSSGSDVREGSGSEDITITTTAGGSAGHHVRVTASSVPGPPPAVPTAAGSQSQSQSQSQSSPSSNTHSVVGHSHTHSPFHPT